jgi:hypothetical protein
MRKALILLGLAPIALVWWAVTAGPAAGQGTAPVVTTAAATNVTSSAATLNGTVNPEGQATVYAFQWGPTAGYGHETPLPPASAGSGTTAIAETAALSGLDPGTAYHYRVIAISAGGVTTGTDQTFTTLGSPPAPTTPPTVVTTPETNVGPNSATLNGTVDPNGQSTRYYFEYGTTNAYGFETASTNAGAGSSPVSASANLTGLQPGAQYHYRLVAVSAGGTTLGTDQTLTTTPTPIVTTGAATSVGPTGATLNGTVNPNGHATTDYFQFGTTTAYGLQTSPVGAGSGTANVAVSSQLTALQSATTYHYRLVAVNSRGTTFGSDKTFTTAGATPSSSRLGLFGTSAFVSPHGVAGVFVGCFGSSTCTGSLRISRSGVTLGQRARFTVKANDGGIVHLTLSSLGSRLLRQRHQLRVQTVLTETGAKPTSAILTLNQFS